MPSKWMQSYMNRKYEDHKKRVREAKCTIDLGKPLDMPMSMRGEIERRRVQNAIEKDNRLLLDRLAIAMSRKNIDNELKVKPFTSYIELQRKRELQKICTENRVLLGRIQNTVPSYKHIEWERDAEKRVEYLRNMTEFPDLFVPPVTKFTHSSRSHTHSAHGKARSKSPTQTAANTAANAHVTTPMTMTSVPNPSPLPPPGFMRDPMLQSELDLMESLSEEQGYGLGPGYYGQQEQMPMYTQTQGQTPMRHPMMRGNTLPPLDR